MQLVPFWWVVSVMKYAFSVVVKKDREEALADRLIIKEFKLCVAIAPSHQQRLRVMGVQPFVNELLQAILRQKEDNHEDLISERFLDTLLDTYLESHLHHKDALLDLSKHDFLLKSEVLFQSKREWRCFAALLPPLLRVTVVAEIAIGTLIDVGTFQLSENFLPINPLSKQVLAVSQTLLSALFSLFLAFSEPGMAFMSDFGAVVDDYIKKIFDRCRGRAAVVQRAAVLEALPWQLSAKITSCQSLFCVLAMNSFVTHVLQDYQQMVSLKDAIVTTNDNAFVPPWGTIVASWVKFGLNQLNDPIQLLSLVMLGFAWIRGYFSLEWMGGQGVRYMDGDTAQWLAVDSVPTSLVVEVEPGSPSAAITHGMGPFSSGDGARHESMSDRLLPKRGHGLLESD